jgi:hypothetical protein
MTNHRRAGGLDGGGREGKGEIAGALMVDVKGVFLTVKEACLRGEMREMGLDEGWIGWV